MFWIHILGVCLATIVFFGTIGYLTIKTFALKFPMSLSLPFGFVIYQAIFWLGAVSGVYRGVSWQQVSLTVQAALLLYLLLLLLRLDTKKIKSMEKKYPLNTKRLLFLAVVVLIGLGHGVLQVGFWSTDHALSDNSFYLAIATAAEQSNALFQVNPADGMAGSLLNSSYLISTYELSMTFLSGWTGLSPAAYTVLIVPIVASVATMLIYFELFYKFVRSNRLALVGLVVFMVTIYAAPNYRSNINDFHMEEWFIFYYYTGKTLVRYLAMPVFIYTMITLFEKLQADKTKRIIFWNEIMLLNLVTISFYALSPVASIYALALLFVFMVCVVITRARTCWRVLIYGAASIMGFVGLLLSAWTAFFFKDAVAMGEQAINTSPLRYLGIGSEHFTWESFQSFFVTPVASNGFWYYRWQNILMVCIILASILIGCFYLIVRKKELGSELRAMWQHSLQKYPTLVNFGLLYPLIYILFVCSPPIVEIVSGRLFTFAQQRLAGNYIFEIVVLSWLLVIIKEVLLVLNVREEAQKVKHLVEYNTIIVMLILAVLFTQFPSRPFVYQQAMDQERVARLRFQDDYYDGTINFERLTTNPEKADNQAMQITNVLAEIPGQKIAVGTINQFFGLSHVRVTHADISVVKTRFTTYPTSKQNDAAFLLKYYFSPWEEKSVTYQEDYSVQDVEQAMDLFDVNYLIVVKSYKEQVDFGNVMADRFAHRIGERYETDDFYIFEIQ